MTDKKIFKLSDDFIAIVRELVQLSLLTGTNLVDHLRAVEATSNEEEVERLIPTDEYVEAYNEMVSNLVKKAEESQKKLDEELAAGTEFAEKSPEEVN